MNELDLFIAANAIANPAERAAYLGRVCADQPELRRRLEALLAGNALSRHPLDQPPSHPPAAADATLTLGNPAATGNFQPAPSTETEGAIVAGRYKLRQQIGEGGMGTVWMADQTEPVKRKVAVKLIRVERGQSKTILARFEAERQAIALMDHPHIARLLDAGTTGTGSPFFVMELVKGTPLNDFCDQHKLTIAERLNLFTQICSAVQHAHQKGIIHRDLKPGNILVESHDGKPVPKVIDFGLAKATTGLQLGEQSMFTAFGSVMGTPLYMAPEQASFNAVDVDTRADVYALGVILYELLTGTTPLTKETMKKAALDEMLRLVREQEAPTPSSRLSSADSTPSVAGNRQIEPAKLGRFVKGELDWIVMKALAKDRDRRYETANGFARDIERFLNHEPVQAGPPSASYRFKKFVQRNRGQVIAASLVLLALVGGAVGTTVGLIEAKKQTERAQIQEAEARKQERIAKEEATAKGIALDAEKAAKAEAEANLKQAKDNLAFATKGNEILGSVFAGLDPNANYSTVAELRDALKANLRKAVAELDGTAIGDPLVVAAMQNSLGLSLLGLGEFEQAITLFARARETRTARLGANDPDTLTTMSNMAAGYREAGKRDRALLLYEETYKRMKANIGADHPDTIATMNNLAGSYRDDGKLDLALPLYKEAFELIKAKRGADDQGTLVSMGNLADCYRTAGQLELALPLLEESFKLKMVKFGADDPSTLASRSNLALGYLDAGKLDRALPLLEENFKLSKPKLGADHPGTLTSMHNLALGYRVAGKLDRALPLYEETLKLKKTKIGADHPETLTTMNSLALSYQAAGKLDLALPLLEEMVKLRKTKIGADHPDTLASMNKLAAGYQDAGKLDLALPLYEESFKLRKANVGADHPDTLTSMNNLAVCYWLMERLDKSVPLFEELLSLREKKHGRQHSNTQIAVANLGVNYKDAGRLVEALPLLDEAYQSSRRIPELLWIGGELLEGYVWAGKRTEAIQLIGGMLDDARRTLPKDSPQLAGSLAPNGLALLDLRAFAEAESLLRECLAIREKTQPDAWTTFNTQSMLGGALLGQKKYADAEPLLQKGYQGLKEREKTIPKEGGGEYRIPEALSRLIALYTATDKPDEVKKYKELRAKYPPPVAPMPKVVK